MNQDSNEQIRRYSPTPAVETGFVERSADSAGILSRVYRPNQFLRQEFLRRMFTTSVTRLLSSRSISTLIPSFNLQSTSSGYSGRTA